MDGHTQAACMGAQFSPVPLNRISHDMRHLATPAEICLPCYSLTAVLSQTDYLKPQYTDTLPIYGIGQSTGGSGHSTGDNRHSTWDSTHSTGGSTHSTGGGQPPTVTKEAHSATIPQATRFILKVLIHGGLPAAWIPLLHAHPHRWRSHGTVTLATRCPLTDTIISCYAAASVYCFHACLGSRFFKGLRSLTT